MHALETEPQSFEAMHPEFFRSLEAMPDDRLIPQLQQRGYQICGIAKTREGILEGKPHGLWEIGTGGGKTGMALNIVAQTRGKVLWLAPSLAAATRFDNEVKKLGIARTVQRIDGEHRRFKDFDPNVEVTVVTPQGMVRNNGYENISRDHFSFAVLDEAHAMLGRKMREPSRYFLCPQVHMTATPANTVHHVKEIVPHTFYKYSSEDLIDNEGFPEWVLVQYEVQNEDLSEAKVVGDSFVLDGHESQYLNMPDRFKIARDIVREVLEKKGKVLVFMPTCKSSKEFVDKIMGNKDIIHVDGTTARREDLEEAFNDGRIRAVSNNMVWSESISVDDITDIVLCDPCISLRLLLQRIGRGARPAKGKKCLRIHDVISTVVHARMTTLKERTPLSVAGTFDVRDYAPNLVLLGKNRGRQALYADSRGRTLNKARYREVTRATAQPISFQQRGLDLAFMQDAEYASQLLGVFAHRFCVDPVNVVFFPGNYVARKEEVLVHMPNGDKLTVDFRDVFEATTLFGSLDEVRAIVAKRVDEACSGLQAEVGKAEEAADDYEYYMDAFDAHRIPAMALDDQYEAKVWEIIFKMIHGNRSNKVQRAVDVMSEEVFSEKYESGLSNKEWLAFKKSLRDGSFEKVGAENGIVVKINKLGVEERRGNDPWNGRCFVVIDVEASRKLWTKDVQRKMFERMEALGLYLGPPYRKALFSMPAHPFNTKSLDQLVVHDEDEREALRWIFQEVEKTPEGDLVIDMAKSRLSVFRRSPREKTSRFLDTLRANNICFERKYGDQLVININKTYQLWDLALTEEDEWIEPHVSVRRTSRDKLPEIDSMRKWAILEITFANKEWQKNWAAFLDKNKDPERQSVLKFLGDFSEGSSKKGKRKDDLSKDSERYFALLALTGMSIMKAKDDVVNGFVFLDESDIQVGLPVSAPANLGLKEIPYGKGTIIGFPKERHVRPVPQGYENNISQSILKAVFGARRKGESTVTIDFEYEDEVVDFVDELTYTRLYFKAFGFEGDVLKVVGPLDEKRVTLSLEGIEVEKRLSF